MSQQLIVITGPTASGKTGLAIEMAERHNGEIICADSRTIYKGMDIGTAKPTAEEQRHVPHHLLDVIEPGDSFTAHDFQRQALETIAAIRARGKEPFLVGGTGLYIDAVVREYSWPVQVSDDAKKATLQSQSIEKLQTMIKEQRLVMPENSLNKRHLINTLLRAGEMGSALTKPRDDTVVVAIRTPKEILEERIRQRAHAMFDSGVIQETVRLAERYGWDSEAMKSNIYPIVRRVIEGDLSQAEAIELFVRKDLQLAKRQLTWLRRYEYVKWFDLDEARDYIETRLR